MKVAPAAVLAGFIVLSCGGDRGGDYSQLLTVAIDVGPGSLDPRLDSDESSRRIQQLLFNGLVTFDERGEPRGDLAASWENPDPLVYVFHLRPGVLFQDGKPLTSEDVRYTMESILRDEVPSFRKGDLAVIRSVETPDPSTIRFNLKEPFAPFVSNLSLGILPRGAGADAAAHPVGTGPYRLVRYRKDQDLLLESFAGYFEGMPGVKGIRLKIVPEATARQQELLKGSVDLVVNDLNPDQVDALKKEPRLRVLTSPSNSYAYLGFNLEDPILKDVRVRRAVAFAIDRDRMIHVLLHGLARPSTGLLPPDHWAYQGRVATYPHDNARAIALLDAAGYPDPDGPGPASRFRLTCKTSTAQLSRDQASVFQEQLHAVGIDLEIRSFEWGTFYDDIKAGRFQVFSLQWTQILDPDVYRLRFGSAFLPPAGFNRGHYVNPEVDRLLLQGTRAASREERRSAYSRLQEILAEEVPYVSLWHKSNVAVLSERVEGFSLTPAGDFSVLARVTLKP